MSTRDIVSFDLIWYEAAEVCAHFCYATLNERAEVAVEGDGIGWGHGQRNGLQANL
jgi:hypothetical protein